MLKASHATLITLSGLIWLAVGFFLLPLGLNFVVESILKENLATLSRPFLDRLAPYVGGVEPAALMLIAFSLFIGYLKGHYIFAKTVRKGVARILELPNPARLGAIYTKKYYLLLAIMMGLGFVVRAAPLDVRGAVDIIIGSALINGALLYFRQAFYVSKKSRKISEG